MEKSLKGKRVIFESREGPLSSRPCPFGGSGQIVVKENDEGLVLGKCELAERVWLEWQESSFFTKPDVTSLMKRMGCPHPPRVSFFGGWRKRCKYNFGRWTEI